MAAFVLGASAWVAVVFDRVSLPPVWEGVAAYGGGLLAGIALGMLWRQFYERSR